MKKPYLSLVLFFGLFFACSAGAATADHIVISEIQIDSVAGTGGIEDDWVELYNPTGGAVVLDGWSIQKTSKTGGSLYRKELAGSIPAGGYFLIVRNHADTAQSLKDAADVLAAGSSFSLADDNTVYLVSNNEDVTGASDPDIVDMVGIGEASRFEGVAAPNPQDGGSIERLPGGSSGNGEDTDNNSADFFAQTVPSPGAAGTSGHAEEEDESGEEEEEDPPADEEEEEQQGAEAAINLEITEIFPDPAGSDSGSEWVELINLGAELDLSGWYIDDSGDALGTSAYRLADGTIAGSGAYLSIIIPKGRFALNNAGGDEVRIFDQHKILRLRQSYPGPAKVAHSYAKDSHGLWHWTETPTPGSANVFTVETVYPKTLIVSEVLPDPEGDDVEGEFIEIYNQGTESIDLADWVVSDARKRYVITEEDFFDTEIPARGYFVVYREVSSIALNNSGPESAAIYNPRGEAAHEISFDAKGKSGQSYSWVSGSNYQWTTTPTPGAANKQDASGDENENEDEEEDQESEAAAADDEDSENLTRIELKDIRSLSPGDMVRTSGTVAVEPGVLDEQVIYLSGSGIRVFLPAGFETEISAGMIVELSGELSSYHNESQIKIMDASDIVLSGEVGELTAHDIETGEVGEQTEGFLVKIAGEITRSSGTTFYLDDGSGEARVLIKDSTGIVKPATRKGDFVTITGIVTQFNDVYRVLPRYQDDLVLGAVSGVSSLPRTGLDFWLVLAVFSLLLNLTLLFFLINKPKSLPEPR